MADLPRSAWNGTLRLRELVLPVGLVSAKRKGDVDLRVLHQCGARVARTNVCPTHGEVPADELVKGWEIAPGEYLPVDPGELAAIAPRDTRMIDVHAIVPAAELDERLGARTYLLLPTPNAVSRTGYALLARAMGAEEVVALARFTAWNTEHVVAIAPRGDVLEVRELDPVESLRDPTPIEELFTATVSDDGQLDAARRLLAKLVVPFTPALLTNLHRSRVANLLDARLAGGTETIRDDNVEPAPAVTVDIAAALERSLRTVPRSRKARVDEALART